MGIIHLLCAVLSSNSSVNKSNKLSRLQLFRFTFLRTFRVCIFCFFGVIVSPFSSTQAAVPGAMQGEFSVSPSGAATYQIPITVPPGVNGMQPELALVYNSQGGNGHLGVRWSLAGLSSITRCPATLAQDGFTDGVDFDSNDRFCLDGQRLVPVGVDGNEYRTEIETFSRVKSSGWTGSGPNSFTVETKAGRVMEYGVTADSRIEAAGRSDVLVWALNKVNDRHGNQLTVSYADHYSEGDFYPTRVDYAQGHFVEFEYHSRPDVSPSFVGGSASKITKRLAYARTYADGVLVREYRLIYDSIGSTSRSAISNIYECDSQGSCFNATSFNWQSTDFINTSYSNQNSTYIGSGGSSSDRWFIAADVNGDGRSDYVKYELSTGNVSTWLSTGSGFTAGVTMYIGSGGSTSDRWFTVADVSGDGLADLVKYEPTTGYARTWVSTGSEFATGSTTYIGSGGAPSDRWFTVADVNGDGMSDYVTYEPESGATQTYLSTGTGFVAGARYTIGNGGSPEDRWFTTADINGDGMADYVRYELNSGVARTWLSTGNGFTDGSQIQIGSGGSTSDRWFTVADVNGDGMDDLVKFEPLSGNVTSWLSTGTGFIVGSTTYVGNGGSPSDRWFEVADVNADGMADYITYVPGSGYARTWLSTGSGFVEGTISYIGNGGSPSDRWFTLADVNGDGLAEFIKYQLGDGNVTAWGISGMPDTVDKINNSTGTITNIAFKPLTDTSVYSKGSGASYPEREMQFPMYVVSVVQSDDGLGGAPSRNTLHDYAGLKANLHGRGLLGFANMKTTDQSTGATTTTYYSQNFPTAGMPKSTVQSVGGIKINEQTNDYGYTQTHSGVFFPFVTQSVNYSYELNNGVGVNWVSSSTSSFDYDGYGNVTRSVTSTIGEGLTGSHEIFTAVTNNTYATGTWSWPPTRLERTEVTKYLPSYTSALDGSCVNNDCARRVSSFAYNSTNGVITSEVIEPDNPDHRLQTDYDYDAFGNTLVTTVSGGSGGTAITSRASSVSYDSKGRFPLSTTNALGHTATRTWDARFGVPLTMTGPNGITTTWTYDNFGRKLTESRVDGTTTTITRQWCNGFNNETGIATCPTGGVLATTTQSTGSAVSTVYVDKLGRTIRSETKGFNGTPIYVDTIYNALGQVHKKSRPYFSGGTAYYSTFSYDAVGRVYAELGPDGNTSTTTYSGLSTTVTNANNQSTTQIKNAIGELIKATDADSNSNLYRYDPHGNLIAAEDSAGNIISSGFNIRGHKISMNDPDMGAWTYEYNVLGELVKQTDAKGQVVTNTYDKLGRMTQRVEAEGTSSWTYDTAAKGIGKPASSYGAEGINKTFAYDNFGRPSSVTTTIDSTAYTVTRSYDSAGRLNTLTYPVSPNNVNGLGVQHHYNAQGYLTDVKNAATQASYWQAGARDADGQLTLATYGNGVVTDQVFNQQTGRLQSILTHKGGANIQDLSFTFDAIGNLTRRDDFKRGVNETFQYDNLNRVTSSNVAGNATASGSYIYDAIGNITSKTNVGAYLYGAGNAGPHAVTSVSNGGVTRTFTYDANGNLLTNYNFTAAADRTVNWTSYNKPLTISQGGSSATFQYGADRARFKQTATVNGQATTRIYVGSLYEKETVGSKVSHLHYIRAGGQTVAIYKSISDNGVNSSAINYLHRDHIGSVSEITDGNGVVVESLSFDAFGKRRNVNWSDATSQIVAQNTKRSFTGHEYLDDVGLIHMNGRVYDPDLGRFMSADPFVKFAASTQGFNRYSYTDNNPLSRVDPSGFGWNPFKKVSKAFKRVVRSVRNELSRFESRFRHEIRRKGSLLGSAIQIVGTWACPVCAPYLAAGVTAAQGGGVEDVTRSFAVSYASGYVSRAFNGAKATGWKKLGNVTYEATIMGAVSAASGGSFNSGFARSFGVRYLRIGIESWTNSELTYKPGKGTGFKPEGTAVVDPNLNNLGIANKLPDKYRGLIEFEKYTANVGSYSAGVLHEGGLVSTAVNTLPGMNSGSVLHDTFANFFEANTSNSIVNNVSNFFTNQATILPVIGVNYVALAGTDTYNVNWYRDRESQ